MQRKFKRETEGSRGKRLILCRGLQCSLRLEHMFKTYFHKSRQPHVRDALQQASGIPDLLSTQLRGAGVCAFLITTGSRHRPNYFLILVTSTHNSLHPIQSRRYQPVIRSERSYVANREGGLQQRKKFQEIDSYLQFVTNQPRYVQPARNEGRIGSVELYNNWFIQIGELLNVPHGNLSLYSHLYEGEPSMREHPCTLHETHICRWS